MVAEEVVVILSGGAPWGFRLQGGAEQQMPLQVAKVRKRSKACRAGLRETDELVSINDIPCDTLSHAEAMNLIDTGRGNLHLRIKRAPAAFQSVVLLGRAPSPRIDKEYRAALRALSPPLTSNPPGVNRASLMSPTGGLECLTSPPDSEAYYGETDSDADVMAQERQRRQRRRSPSCSPAKSPGPVSPQEEETSELSGYESAQDVSWAVTDMNGMAKQQHHAMPGVARREVVYQPQQPEWSHREENSSENSDQSPSGTAEVDSGFQEPPSVPPLVSPERAKGALMLASHRLMVPMVGPVNKPVDEELSATYMDKAKQAKLHRGESKQDKQVKEARSKCRTIASLLTDAPNPHSKGVLMFKKRRQRAKKYTLTSFGSVDGESYSTTEGETEDESFFPGSDSELDEDGFSAAPDPTWDSGYLDVLDRRTSACIVPDRDVKTNLGLNATSGKGAQLFEQQRKRAEEHTSNLVTPSVLPMSYHLGDTTLAYTPFTPVAPLTTFHSTNMLNGEPLVVSRTSVVLSSPGQTPMPSMAGALPEQADSSVASSVHNRTARPFAPGCVSHRAATAPVVFRPNTAKKAESQIKAVSVATIPASFSPASSEVKKAVSTTSLYIPARPTTFNGLSSVIGPSSLLSPSSVTSGPFSPPPSNAPFNTPTYSSSSAPFSPTASHATSLNSPSVMVQPYSSQTQAMPLSPPYHKVSTQYQPPPPVHVPAQPFSPPFTNSPVPPNAFIHAPAPPNAFTHAPASAPHNTFIHALATPYALTHAPAPPNAFTHARAPASVHAYAPVTPNVQTSPTHKVSFNPYISVASTTPELPDTPMPQQYQEAKSTEGISSREQRASVPAGRTGILQEACRRGSSKKPMFNTQEEKKPPSYNPELLSLVQNLDERSHSGAEAGFESGPEEDLLNLGAEACNFMQAQKNKMPPPVAPKIGRPAPEIPQMQGKGAELFARRQNRMDRYVVDKYPKTPEQPRDPSPTPSLPAHWKYSPNIRAPPPINYNPLLSPSCPPVAQRSTKANDASKVGVKTAPGQHKPGIKALDFMSRQPYQLNSSLFSYGGGVPQTIASYQQQQNGISMTGNSINMPKQVPVKASRVYEIKRFSTPTPMSAPTALSPTVIAPRSATTLGEPMWRSDVTSPPPVAPRPMAPFSPPPPAPTTALPALPKISTVPVPYSVPIQQPTTPLQAYTPFQAAKQFQSAPELSPLSAGLQCSVSGSSQNLRVPRPRFSTSSMGLQPNVWRPGSILY
ncbi:synaptopodin 2-like protein [Triplophysa rosa]|uniref:Synaptopodin 2-like protein n=1 Tax=Triplophysa rosa TaxID=992332 RepID=A0A9W7TDZ8_TRIRA|nr:synaptopodin 2-like protein [Triplophysa rosa]KAI7796843.1 putative synaptopodin 2-like protein [Triplophysa rosa]